MFQTRERELHTTLEAENTLEKTSLKAAAKRPSGKRSPTASAKDASLPMWGITVSQN